MLELEPKNAPVPPPAVVAGALELRVAEILASPRRMWLRGRLIDKDAPPENRYRFLRLWGRHEVPAPRPARLLTHVSNRDLAADVTLTPSGYFEASLAEQLPPARRGWRVARTTLRVGDEKAEGCGLVFTVPEQARRAVVVVLPLASTAAGKFDSLTTAENLTWTGKILEGLADTRRGPCPVYYLGCAPLRAESRQQELALAVSALGWPAGTVVLLPDETANGLDRLRHGLDRLRWLFADSLTLSVVNLEPELTTTLGNRLAAQQDRADVKLLLNPGDEPDSEAGEEAKRQAGGLRPVFSHRLTRYPLVFCHGMLGMSALRMQLPEHLNYFRPLEPFLSEHGFRALYPDVPATGSVAERAERLKEQIRRWTREPINLIAHSMGGLDCRYLITRLGMADHVASLTTIATPHHGTYVAEWFIRNYRHRFPLLFAMEALGVDMAGFRACLCASCADFNARTPDAPQVRYFSYGAAVTQAQVNPVLRRVWNILTAVEGPNDGLVSVASAHWGEYLGTLNADHFAQTPDSILAHANHTFDPLGFYLHVAEDLARQGF